LKVIVLGNSTAGKTSLVKYWGNKTFDERQVSTHGIYTPMDIPVQGGQHDRTFRVNVWDFGGQDYYHATHRLFITRDSVFIIVCDRTLESKPRQELTTEYEADENGVVKEIEVLVQHYPYSYWTDTLAHLTGAHRDVDTVRMPLFLIENKCAEYAEDDNRKMSLTEEERNQIPFDIIGNEFYHLDIKAAYKYHNSNSDELENAPFAVSYQKFEKKLISILQKQIADNKYEVLSYFPIVRDTLERLAKARQTDEAVEEINHFLEQSGIKPISEFAKLPVWITSDEYREIVKNSRKVKQNEGKIPWASLHTYLQNLCGSIFHFDNIPKLKDIVFIDPNWLHTSIYKVLNMEVLENKG